MKPDYLPTLDLKRNYHRIRQEIQGALNEVLDEQSFILGPAVSAFEADVATYLPVSHAVGCASGSDALLLALMALDLKPGDEVITSPFTFFATVSAITRLGAKPVFVDVDPETYNMKTDAVLASVTDRTRAVIAVHLFGQMVPLEEIDEELKGRGIVLVEDAAQAFGSWRMKKNEPVRAGAWGDLGCFSFFPTKNLGGYGDGGMITARDEALARRLRSLRVHGSGRTYFHEEVGLNSRLDSLQAAVLRVKLRHLDEWNEERRLVADRYGLLFAEAGLNDVVQAPTVLEGNSHIFHQYVIRCSRRDALQAFLEEQGIASRVYYPLPLHEQRCFAFLGHGKGDFPTAEALAEDVLALPVFPELTASEQERVVDAMAHFYGQS
ncbi:MAG: DegT/DnrJ/EryC1/StrS family aminotransferase [Synergistaceae bacterium]|jgi:dTDP-4-amino-4,6-dideoxygalactose transaminase|nr:DegT/DnrJ/EryC1/StrS family aminotransferase [Synergistaceae bacterium]